MEFLDPGDQVAPQQSLARDAQPFREVYRQPSNPPDPYGDTAYEPFIEVNDAGIVRMHCGGYVVAKSIKDWMEMAWPGSERGLMGPPAA
jgi:hypothetical protein